MFIILYYIHSMGIEDITGKAKKSTDYCECSLRKAEAMYKKYNEVNKLANRKAFDELEDDEKISWLKMAGRKPLPEKDTATGF